MLFPRWAMRGKGLGVWPGAYPRALSCGREAAGRLVTGWEVGWDAGGYAWECGNVPANAGGAERSRWLGAPFGAEAELWSVGGDGVKEWAGEEYGVRCSMESWSWGGDVQEKGIVQRQRRKVRLGSARGVLLGQGGN